MSKILGIDIGGANIKIVVLDEEGRARTAIREYFPLWKKGREGLECKLCEFADKLCPDDCLVAVCMTAELCDIYENKSEGVQHVVESVVGAFKKAVKIEFVTCNMELVDADKALREPLKVAAANWAASAWLVAKLCRSCVFADIGSTTTTIIPVYEGKPLIRGYTDPEKLTYGELVYVGTLRTSVSELVQELPYKGQIATVCREYFATIGDVNLLLGKIGPSEYSVDTADGRGKTIQEAAARLARTVCSSLELMNIQEVKELARYVYLMTIVKIAQALLQVRTWLASINVPVEELPLVTAGIGEFMLEDAGKLAGFSKIISIDDIVREPVKVSPVLPSYACAKMMWEKHIKSPGRA